MKLRGDYARGVRPSSGAGTFAEKSGSQQGSVLIIVLWIAFGLVSVALYFAHSMSMELRAADNRAAAIEAEQAIAGAARYVTNVLGRVQEPGMIPNLTSYRSEAVPVGESTFWLIGRNDRQPSQIATADRPAFGLVDEGSKLNLNAVSLEMLEMLPRMTPELAAAIIDWRDSNSDVTQGGAESETYLRRNPPYNCKNANFESVDELRLVYGAELDIIYGEDANLNGVLDPNENDADTAVPNDNRDGRLDPGFFEYFTVYTREPPANTRTNVNTAQQLRALVQATFSGDRAQAILSSLGNGFGSLLEFYIRSGMSKDEFMQIEGQLIGTNTVGLVNVNTASEAVLACIPGIGTDHAPTLVAYRQTNPDQLNTLTWVKDALGWSAADLQAIQRAGPWLTGRSYQFTADIAAVGHHGRGYQRVKYVFDTTEGAGRICYRQDLTHLGWALGRQAREALLLAKDIR